MPAKLSLEEVHAFLDSKPGWIILSTFGPNGYPHSVPLGYFRVGDDIYLGCRPGTQKVKNIARNPRVSLVLESGSTRSDIKGVLIQGEAIVYTDPDNILRLSREAARLRGEPHAQWPQQPRPGAAYIRVQPRRIVSWDYGRDASS